MIGRYQSWPKWVITICACAFLVFSENLHATEQKEVLILHSFGRALGPWNEYSKQIRAELDRQSPWRLDIREYSLETARFSNLDPEPHFVEYLGALYANHAPDLMVAIGAPAAPLKDIADAEPASDLLDIDGFAFERKARIASDHEQPFENARAR